MSELGWQPFPGAGAPVEVTESGARGGEAGLGVGAAAFTSPDTGWVVAGDGEAAQCRVLFTGDAGATWRTRLAWRGLLLGRFAAFGEGQAGLGLSVSQGDDVNGYRPDPRPPGDPFLGPDAFLASTQDAGATWTLAPMPDRQASGFHFLAPRQAWVQARVSDLVPVGDGSYVRREGGARCDLIRTRDGGMTWQRIRGMAGVGAMTVRFQSEAEGLLVATGEGNRVDRLYQTADGGLSWEPVSLAPPAGLPASAITLLDPVPGADGGVLLVLSARSRAESQRRPRWEGSYAYRRDGQQGWAGPYLLPAACLGMPHVAVPASDGRIWAAAGKNLFVAADPAGPWQRREASLPAGQVITGLNPVGDGVLWMATRPFPALPYPALTAVSGGQLYRSTDDGAHWNRVTV